MLSKETWLYGCFHKHPWYNHSRIGDEPASVFPSNVSVTVRLHLIYERTLTTPIKWQGVEHCSIPGSTSLKMNRVDTKFDEMFTTSPDVMFLPCWCWHSAIVCHWHAWLVCPTWYHCDLCGLVSLKYHWASTKKFTGSLAIYGWFCQWVGHAPKNTWLCPCIWCVLAGSVVPYSVLQLLIQLFNSYLVLPYTSCSYVVQ